MADLTLSEDSLQLQKLARDFAVNEVLPKVEHLDASGEFPTSLLKAAWELGLINTTLKESFGGLELSLFDSAIIIEEFASVCAGFAAAAQGNLAAIATLSQADSAIQEKYLPLLSEKPCFAGFALAHKKTTTTADEEAYPAAYEKTGDHFLIKNARLYVLNGSQCQWLVFPARDGSSGNLSIFVASKTTSGIASGEQLYKLGRRCSDIAELSLENVSMSNENLVGALGQGHGILSTANYVDAVIAAAIATGISGAALRHSLQYSQERQTFGKPISSYQSISFMMADMARMRQSSRLLYLKAAWLYDQDRNKAKLSQALSARAYAFDAAISCATDAVQIFGGYGYSKEYPVEKLMRDAKMLQMMSGSSLLNKLAIGRELAGVCK